MEEKQLYITGVSEGKQLYIMGVLQGKQLYITGIKGNVLIKISDKTVMPEIVYNVKKKLGCIFIENHNSESLDLKRG